MKVQFINLSSLSVTKTAQRVKVVPPSRQTPSKLAASLVLTFLGGRIMLQVYQQAIALNAFARVLITMLAHLLQWGIYTLCPLLFSLEVTQSGILY